MTINQLFIKSKNILYANSIEFVGSGRKKEYYKISSLETKENYEVTLETTEQGLQATCTCMSKTFHCDKPTFCSHILSVLFYKYGKVKI
jgi:hypothetical protein